MPKKKRTATMAGVAAAICIVLLNTWFAFASIRTLRQSEFWLSHTWQVIGQVERILGLAREGESSVRGYVITGNDEFLTPFYVTEREIQTEISAFDRLTADNPRQRPNGALIARAARDRFASLKTVVQARRNQGSEAAIAEIRTGEGIRQMDMLRSAGNAMEDEERRLLGMREADVHRSAVIANVAIGLASVLDLLLIVLVGRFLLRERGMRLATEAANAQLALANSEIANNASVIQRMNEDLEERVRVRTAELESTNRELEAFSYSVSHDLRAPLRTIDGFSLALEEDYHDVVGEEGRDYIQRVRGGVQRMGGLIDALLQLSRITRAEFVREEVNVTELAQTVAENLKEENPSQIIEFEIQQDMHASADAHLLQVAFENLMGNAVKFSSKVPVSHVIVAQDRTSGEFRITDNGAGFDMYYASKLFNAFNRLHGDKDFKGSGIGLATVARVIRRHHGTITAESRVGHGATFRFTVG